MRAHASWGSQNDVFVAFLNKETMDNFNMGEEDYALMKEAEKAQKANKDEKSDKSVGAKKEEIVVELEGLEDRVQRLTPMSSNVADARSSGCGNLAKIKGVCMFTLLSVHWADRITAMSRWNGES